MFTLSIKGHSGCGLNVFERDNELLVRKTPSSADYIKRLKKQFDKQNDAWNNLTGCGDILVPKCSWEDNNIIMEYVPGISYAEFFETANTTNIDLFVNALIGYIDNEYKNSCTVEPINKDILINKLYDISKNVKLNSMIISCSSVDYFTEYCNELINHINNMGDIVIPVGTCHGDLTFSNIIFTNNQYTLIDFLDSFIETPLQDIVKIRQDSKYLWSMNMLEKQHNTIRIKTVSRYIDEKIDRYYSNYVWYRNHYKLLQQINILRIAPYVKESSIVYFIQNVLENLRKS